MKAISKRKKMDYISGYTMILPLVLGLGVFYFYPIFKVFYDSFHEVGALIKLNGSDWKITYKCFTIQQCGMHYLIP
ncbi:MAG: hypothetical protein ACLTS6_04745 [Anaerobutyricum sp.]